LWVFEASDVERGGTISRHAEPYLVSEGQWVVVGQIGQIGGLGDYLLERVEVSLVEFIGKQIAVTVESSFKHCDSIVDVD